MYGARSNLYCSIDRASTLRYYSPIMASERVQRQIDSLLDEAEAAISQFDWEKVRQCAQAVLRLDPENTDALFYLAAADRDSGFAAAPPIQETAQGNRVLTKEHLEEVVLDPTGFKPFTLDTPFESGFLLQHIEGNLA